MIAKPAEQTPLMAAKAVALLHEAGIPKDVLHLLPGKGEVIGAALTKDPRVKGVIFTGSTDTAHAINMTLASRGGASFVTNHMQEWTKSFMLQFFDAINFKNTGSKICAFIEQR